MRTCSTFLTALAMAALPLTAAYAQDGSSLSMPSMPSVSMPDMPSLSFDSISQGTAQAQQSTASAKKSTLSASDLSALSTMGSLDTLSSLLGSSSGSSSYLSLLYGDQDSSTTNLLLQQILTELEELKKSTAVQTSAETTETQAAAQEAESTGATSDSGTTAQQAVPRPRILRFSVNGYNILSTCTRIFISAPEEDGTFLVTGDRRYASDGKTRTETFHILFRAAAKQDGLLTYEAASAVSQDYRNEYSFLYQLAQRKNLVATRTGNLVTLRTTDANWKLELLIDLGAAQ